MTKFDLYILCVLIVLFLVGIAAMDKGWIT